MNSAVALQRAAALGFLRLPAPLLRRLAGAPVRSPEGFALDLQTQALLRVMSRIPQLHAHGHVRARRFMEASAPILDAPPAPGVATVDRRAPGPGGDIPVRLYRPAPAAPGAALPALVYFHGGGFVLGSIASHDALCRAIADRAGVAVASVDYRLAPEHRFPAAADDALAAFRWVVANAGALGVDPARVAVGGDSAGGNLAAVVALDARGDARPPAFQLLVYPATDFTRAHPSHAMFAEGFFLTRETMDWFIGHYVAGPEQYRDPRGSVLFAPDLAGAAPAYVVTAGFDPLRDEGRAYADRLRGAGVPVEYVCREGMIHGFISMTGAVDEARRALDDALRALRRALARNPTGRPGAPAPRGATEP